MMKKILKLIASIKFDFSIDENDKALILIERDGEIEFEGNEVNNYHKSTAVINAAFGNRFVLLPFKTMASVLLNQESINEKDLIKLSNENKLLGKFYDPISYIQEYKYWVSTFYENLQLNKSNSVDVITEEVNHNLYIKNTTSYANQQLLTLLLRFLHTYLADIEFKQKSENNDNTVWQTLYDAYLIRATISTSNVPIIEAFEHRNDNLELIEKAYSKVVVAKIKLLKKIENILESLFHKEEVISLLEQIAKNALNFPFTSFIDSYGLTFKKFQAAYVNYPTRSLVSVYRFLKSSENLKYDDVNKFLYKNRSRTGIDYRLSTSLLYHGLGQYLPSEVFYFIITRALTTKYFKVVPNFIKALIKGPDSQLDNSYEDYPAFKSFGLDDQVFNIDPEMSFFENEAFLIAIMSFEPSLLKEKKIVDIMNSRISRSLLLRNFYLKIYFETIYLRRDFKQITESLKYLYSVRPIMKKDFGNINLVVQDIYDDVYSLINIGNSQHVSLLRRFVLNRYTELEKKGGINSCYRLFDICYAHGF